VTVPFLLAHIIPKIKSNFLNFAFPNKDAIVYLQRRFNLVVFVKVGMVVAIAR
jgi:hypothetical protein